MITDLVSQQQPLPLERQTATVSEIITALARDPNVDVARIAGLMELAERAEKRDAERAFVAAFSRLKFPPIVKRRKSHTAKYAAMEDVQSVIDPILAAEGFTLTYSSGPANAKGEVPTLGILAHVAGFSREGVIWLPADGVGTKSGGMNMNALQGVGSSTSYGMRYVAKMMLNLRFVGEDDDGNGGKGFLSKAQADELRRLVMETGATDDTILRTYGAKSFEDVHAINYGAAVNLLLAKYRGKLEKGGMDADGVNRLLKQVMR